MYLHQKIIRIYADIVQNHTLPGVFPNFGRQCILITVCMCVCTCLCYIVGTTRIVKRIVKNIKNSKCIMQTGFSVRGRFRIRG